MFTLIPPQVVKLMTKRRIADLNKADTSDEEEEEATQIEEPEVKPLTASVSFGIKESGEIISQKRQNRLETIDEHRVLLPNSYDGDDEEKTNLSEASDKIKKPNDNLNNSTVVEVIGGEEEEKEKMIQNTPMNSARRRMSQIMSMIPVPWNRQKYNKVGEEESEEDEVEVKKIKREKAKKDKRTSRLDVSSLQAVTRKMHFSYLFAIACIIVALLTAFFIIRHSIQVLSNISTSIESQDYRSILMNAVAMDFSVLTIYRYGGIPSKKFTEHARTDLSSLWNIYNNVSAKSYQLNLMFSEECFSIDSSKCPTSSTPYYNDYNKETLLQEYVEGNVTLSVNNPNYIQLRTMIEVLLDGSERLTYMVYKKSLHKIDETKRTIAIVVGVESVLFVFIYLVLFRPFVKQLRTEIEHTFSLIRMIPRKLLVDVPEIQMFIQDTLDQSEN